MMKVNKPLKVGDFLHKMMMSMNGHWKVKCLSRGYELVTIYPPPHLWSPFLSSVCSLWQWESDNIKAELELSYSHDIQLTYYFWGHLVLGTTSIGPILVKPFSTFRLHANMALSLGFTFWSISFHSRPLESKGMTSQ